MTRDVRQAALLLTKLINEPCSLLFWQPVSPIGSVAQPPQEDDAEQYRRDSLRDEHPLPAMQPGTFVEGAH
jgi:hypothetical protein